MSSITHRPPFDAETEASMNAIAEQLPVITPEMIDPQRLMIAGASASAGGGLAAGAFGDHALPVRDPARDADCCVSQRHDDRAPAARRDRHLDGSRRGAVVLEPCGDRHAPHRA
ncbi:hypothetical protein [Kocuria palustris]|uniref:hypothetical protein n=1 Tax=Kocuria palustris TaxID=71999 RepID=UPI0021A62200|nr:hypothetical protein [Kocuria palustris]MCT1591607.1 hypothetical protein [Kocuria palustris]